MNDTAIEETEQPEHEFNGDTMASYLSDIMGNAEIASDPEYMEQEINRLYKMGEGKWDEEALGMLQEDYDEYKKATQQSRGRGVFEVLPPPDGLADTTAPKEDRLKLIDEWEAEVPEKLKENGSYYDVHKREADEWVKGFATEARRKINGEGKGRFRDLLARSGQAGSTYIADLIGAEDTSDNLAEWFQENPEYDKSFGSAEATAVGQGVGQVGIPLTAGAVAYTGLALAGPAGWAMAGGVAAMSTVGAALSFRDNYNGVYDEVYQRTGSKKRAADAAFKTGVTTSSIEAAINLGVGSKLLSPIVKGLSIGTKTRVMGKLWSAATAAGYHAGSEGAEEGLQDLAAQHFAGEETGAPIDYGRVLENTYLGAVAGLAIGGGTTLATNAGKYRRGEGPGAGGTDKGSSGKPGPIDPEVEKELERLSQFVLEGEADGEATLDHGFVFYDPSEAQTKYGERGGFQMVGEAQSTPTITGAERRQAISERRAVELGRDLDRFVDEGGPDTHGGMELDGVEADQIPAYVSQSLGENGLSIRKNKRSTKLSVTSKTAANPFRVLKQYSQQPFSAASEVPERGPTDTQAEEAIGFPGTLMPVDPDTNVDALEMSESEAIDQQVKMLEARKDAVEREEPADVRVARYEDSLYKVGQALKKTASEKGKRQLAREYGRLRKLRNKAYEDLHNNSFFDSREKELELLNDAVSRGKKARDLLKQNKYEKKAGGTLVQEDLPATPEEKALPYDQRIDVRETVLLDAIASGDTKELRSLLGTKRYPRSTLETARKYARSVGTEVADLGYGYTVGDVLSGLLPQISKVKASRVLSTATDAEYTGNISPALRGIVNGWLSAFNIHNENSPKVYVGTFQNVTDGHFSDVSETLSEELAKGVRDKALDHAGLYVKTNEGKPNEAHFVLLKSGDLTPANLEVASHEVGHLIMERLWDTAPLETKFAVNQDYAAHKREALKSTKLSELAYKMGFDEEMYKNDNRDISELSLAEQKEIIDYITSFDEYYANKVKDFLLDPTRTPVDKANKFYKRIADVLRTMWQRMSAMFRDSSPKLNEWFNEVFSPERMLQTVSEEFRIKATKQRPRQEPTRLAQRIANKSQVKVVRKFFRNETHVAQDMQEAMKTANQVVTSQNFPKWGRDLLSKEVHTLVPQDMVGAYAVATYNQYEAAVAAESDPDRRSELEDDMIKFVADFSEQATNWGRMINMLRLISSTSKPVLKKHWQRKIEKAFADAKMDPPGDLDETLEKIVDKYHKGIKAADKVESPSYLDFHYKNMMQEIYDSFDMPNTGLYAKLFYGSILSGLDTSTINMTHPGLDLLLRSFTNAVSRPSDIPIIYRSTLQGIMRGFVTGKAAFKGTYSAADTERKWNMNRNSLMNRRFRFENKLAKATLEPAANLLLKAYHTYPLGSLRFGDSFMNHLGYAQQEQLALKHFLSKQKHPNGKTYSAKEIATEFTRYNQEAQKAYDDAKIAAETEVDQVFEGIPITKGERRDLIELRSLELRDKTMPQEVQDEAKRYGTLASFTDTPSGTFGMVADAMNVIVTKMPAARYTIFPFVSVVANVLSRSLDYSPIGIMRGYKGNHTFNPKEIAFSELESRQRMWSGIVGTVSLGVLGTFAAAMLKEEKEKGSAWFEWHGKGPSNPSTRINNQSAGIIPYSWRIGNVTWRYHELPGAALFAAVGNLMDIERYGEKHSDDQIAVQAVLSVLAAPQAILETGFLRSIKDVFDVIAGEKSIATPIRTAAIGLTPFEGIRRNMTRIWDDRVLDYNDKKAILLANIPYAQSYVRGKLNVFGEDLDRPNRFFQLASEDPIYAWLASNNLSVPGFRGTVISAGSTDREKRFVAYAEHEREETLGRFAGENFTDYEAHRIQEISGPKIKSRLESVMGSSKADSATLQAFIEKVAREERARAKIQVLSEGLKGNQE